MVVSRHLALLPLLLRPPALRPPAAAMCADRTFAEAYGDSLPPWLVERAEALGYTTPTPVQAEALDAILAGRDAIVLAKTGSGKTLAYMLPLIARLHAQSSVQALVLCPTRELASQVALVARRLAAASPERLLVMALLDGSGARRQRKWLVAQPPQLVVGNVQQVDAVLRAGLLRLGTLRLLVVDEVDMCLADPATCSTLTRMLAGELALATPQQDARGGAGPPPGSRRRQTLFVSATLPQKQHFRRQTVDQNWCAEPPALIHAQPSEPLPTQLRHGWAACDDSKRVAALKVLLRRHAPSMSGAILFVRPSRPLRKLADAVAGIVDEGAPRVLSEDEPLNSRAAAVRALRDGSRRLLLSTPLGARGLDIPHCSHVYLFDLPATADEYVHAAGRCGRMGRPGRVTVLGSPKEEFALTRLANECGVEFYDARTQDL